MNLIVMGYMSWNQVSFFREDRVITIANAMFEMNIQLTTYLDWTIWFDQL